MTEELALRDEPLSVEEIKAQVQLIQKVMKAVMIEGVHYGTIPGCGDKPTLLKPGAEKLSSTFRLAPEISVDDMSVSDEASYRVTVRIKNLAGDFLGAGVGECSSDEDKYKWKKAVCDEEWDEAEEDRKRKKWKIYNNRKYQAKQIRTNFKDVSNTVLKMAKKRALVDAVLTCTAASDIFTQDIEDMDMGTVSNGKPKGKPDVKSPQSKSSKQESQAPVDTGEDEEIRNKMSAMLLQLVDSPDQIPEMIEQYSSFPGKETGETVSRNSISDLSGKWLKSTYGKIKKDWETAGFGGDTASEVGGRKATR